MFYHQTTINETKINELKTIACYKYELMRPSKRIVNLANLKVMFIWLFFFLKSLNLLQMEKVQCKCLHTLQPCKNFMHALCTAVFCATF